jgi:hypothetical protein
MISSFTQKMEYRLKKTFTETIKPINEKKNEINTFIWLHPMHKNATANKRLQKERQV